MAKKKAEIIETETIEPSLEEQSAELEQKYQAEVDNRIKAENATESESFLFKAGTVLKIGEAQLTLTEDSRLFFDGASYEPKVVGMLTVSGNLAVNRPSLEKSYNDLGLEVCETEE